jgi:catechol 2,3-dioxygenase-like lactoylglutathione lyase family enzyme
MKVRHIGLVCSSEDNADHFFGEVLGLRKSETRPLPRALAQAAFEVDLESMLVNYLGEEVHFEVIIDPRREPKRKPIEHVALEVDDLPAFLERCRRAGLTVRRVPRGEDYLTFVLDADGNLFEVKEKKK